MRRVRRAALKRGHFLSARFPCRLGIERFLRGGIFVCACIARRNANTRLGGLGFVLYIFLTIIFLSPFFLPHNLRANARR
ncbi:MAG: hypothetical protein DBX55_04570 [Verrucomicrobia bacterium]|nr:MAG: hypothetical protein DBX55_04570 [Verrucomicrobiota bacterium]